MVTCDCKKMVLGYIDKIVDEIRNFTSLLEEGRDNLEEDNPLKELIEEAISNLAEFENSIFTMKDKVIYTAKLKSLLVEKCIESESIPSNLESLEKIEKRSDSNLLILIEDLDRMREELQNFKGRIEAIHH